jgi:hypothetical protein
MIQGRDGACFAFETVAVTLLGNLDGHIAVQPRIARFPDFAHAAFTDCDFDSIGAKLRSGGAGFRGKGIPFDWREFLLGARDLL